MSRYYIEFEKWNNLSREEKIRQATLAYREERLGVDLAQMVSPYDFVRFRDGKFNFNPDPKAEFAVEENLAANNIFDLFEEGANIVFWFSPAGGNYKEGRLVAAIKEKEEDGTVTLKCRGMPLRWAPTEMMRMAEKMIDDGGMVMDPLYGSESLRSQPIGVKYEGEWTEFCEKTMGMKKLWEYIRWERDVAEVGDLEKIVEKAYVMAHGNSAAFERIMYGWGFRLNPLGNHGGSHLGMDVGWGIFGLDLWGGQMLDQVGFYDFRMTRNNRMVNVEKVRKGNKDICPICGEELSEGVTICPKCRVRLG